MVFDKVFFNGKIITMDEKNPRVTWVAIKDGYIADIGDEFPPLEISTENIDLKGRTMWPGFIDSHVHGASTGFSMNSIDLLRASGIDDVIGAVKNECEKAQSPDEWIFGTGLNVMMLKEGRPPTRWELDAVSGDHPVMIIFVTFHAIACNTKAMDFIKIPSDMDGIVKNDEGDPIGVYTDDESSFLGMSRALGCLSDEKFEKYIRDCVAYANSKGVTTLHTLDGRLVDKDRDFFIWLNIKDTLPIHSVNYYQAMNIPLVKALGLPRIGGCITLDGTGFERTMATSEPYGEPPTTGILYYTDDEVYKFVLDAHKNDLQCSMHAIGDRAIDQLIKTYERVIKEEGNPKGIRHRIEHFGLCSPEHIAKAAELNLGLSMQPVHDFLWDNPNIPGGDTFLNLIGRERADNNDPFPRIIDAGAVIAGGSDSAVTPIDPLWGIHATVNAPNPKRRTSLEDAIKMFTINGAWIAHEEKIKGSIEKGKLADLVVTDKNPYENQNTIMDFKVEMTIVEGEIVYQN